jgi:hypothetical protein
MYIHLPVQCLTCPIWPLLPLNLAYILIFLSQLPWTNLSYTDFLHSTCQISRPFILRIRPSQRPFVTFRNKLIFYGERLLAPRPTPKLEDHLLEWHTNILLPYVPSNNNGCQTMRNVPTNWSCPAQNWIYEACDHAPVCAINFMTVCEGSQITPWKGNNP